MENLQELVNLISLHKVKNISLVGKQNGRNDKLNQFYESLHNGEVTTDDEAAALFYDSNASNINYKKLKYRLQTRLLNTIFFIDTNQPSFNAFKKAYFMCYKNFAAIKILLAQSARRNAISLAEKTLKQALHFDFVDIAVVLLKQLRMHYSLTDLNRKKYDDYNNLLNKYTKILNAEMKAEEYFQEMAMHFMNSRATKLELESLAISYSEELRKYTKQFYSYNLYLQAFRVFVLRYQIVNDYERTLEVCREAVDFFDKKKNFPEVASFTFLFIELSCYIQLKQYEKGEEAAKRCLGLVPEGNRNWFSTMSYYLILCFYRGDFQKGYQIFCRASNHKKFKNLHQNLRENWKIYEAYVHYFIELGKIDPELSPDMELKGKFRISKFMNDLPEFSKDKRGLNITILIIQVLFLLSQKKYGEVLDRVEALQAYCYRYLRKDDTFRSNCFIKMLLIIPKSDFHKEAVMRKTKQLRRKLESVPIEVAKQSNEVEIVPYETLWELVLDSLDNKFHRSR